MIEQNPIYDFMKSNKLTDLDEKTFLSKYSAPDKAKEIHSFFAENDLTDLDSAKFYDKYLKKKELSVPSGEVSSPTELRSVSQDISLTPKTPRKDYYSTKLEKGLIFDKEGQLYAPSSEALSKNITAAEQASLKKSTQKDLVEKSREMPVVVEPTEPIEKQGWLLNTVSALDKGFAKNFISNPIKGLGTVLQGATRKVLGGSGEGAISDALIKYGDYLNNAIDELTPQDEEFKNTLWDQAAQALGQVGSLVATGAISGLGKGATTALVSQAPKGAAIEAAKAIGSQLASPTAISGGLSMGQAEFDRAKQAGATDDQAFEAFYKNAVTGSVLETIPVMQFFKRFNKSTAGGLVNYLKTKGVAGVTGGVEEMTTEILQQLYSNKTAKDIYNINQSILDGVGSSGGVGFGVGFLLNAMGANAKILRKQGKVKEADALENQVNQYEDNLKNPKVTSGDKESAIKIVTKGEAGVDEAVVSLDKDLANNVITPKQHQEGLSFVEKAFQVYDKIPETVTGESRAKSIELLVERGDIKQANDNLLQQKQTADEAYHAGIDEEIKANEERIKKIDSEVYNIAKKPSKEFGTKRYEIDGEEVSKEAFEALTGKPLGTKTIVEPTEIGGLKVIKRVEDFFNAGGEAVYEVEGERFLTADGKELAVAKVKIPKEEVIPTEVKEIGADIINNTESKILLSVDELNRLRTQRETDLATGNAIDLEKNLLKNGIKEPLVITYYPEEGKARLTDGHNRLDVAKDMGAENLPIRIVYDYGEAPSSAKDFILPTKEVKPTEVKASPLKDIENLKGEQSNIRTEESRKIVNAVRRLEGLEPYTGPLDKLYSALKEADDYNASVIFSKLNNLNAAVEAVKNLPSYKGFMAEQAKAEATPIVKKEVKPKQEEVKPTEVALAPPEKMNASQNRYGIVKDGAEAGSIVTGNSKDGFVKIKGVTVNEDLRGKGIAGDAYVKLGNSLAKEGVSLESDSFDKMEPSAVRVWEKLADNGFAIKKENNYQFITEDVEKQVKNRFPVKNLSDLLSFDDPSTGEEKAFRLNEISKHKRWSIYFPKFEKALKNVKSILDYNEVYDQFQRDRGGRFNIYERGVNKDKMQKIWEENLEQLGYDHDNHYVRDVMIEWAKRTQNGMKVPLVDFLQNTDLGIEFSEDVVKAKELQPKAKQEVKPTEVKEEVKVKAPTKELAEGEEVTFNTPEGKKLTGEKITIPGFERIDMVLVKDGLNYTVYDLASGSGLGEGDFSKENAIEFLINQFKEKNITQPKIYGLIYKSTNTSSLENSKNRVPQINPSSMFEYYSGKRKALEKEEYEKLPLKFNSEEIKKLKELKKRAEDFGIDKMAKEIEGAIISRAKEGTFKPKTDYYEGLLKRDIDEKIKKEAEDEAVPYPKEYMKERPRMTMDKLKTIVNEGFKRDKFESIPEDVRKIMLDGYQKNIDILNKYGYYPDEKTKTFFDKLYQYVAAQTKRENRESQIAEAKKELISALDYLNKAHEKEFGKKAEAQPELAPVKEGRTPQVKPLSEFKVGDKFVFATDGGGSEQTVVSIDNGIVSYKRKGSKEISSASEIQRLGNDLALLKSDWDKGIRPSKLEYEGSRFKSRVKPTEKQISNLTKELLRVNYTDADLEAKSEGTPGKVGYVQSAEDWYREIAKEYLENDISTVEVVDDLHGGKERVQRIINQEAVGEIPEITKEEETINQLAETELLLSGEAERRRKEGKFIKDGIEYNRNEKQKGEVGNNGELRFTNDVSLPFKYKLVEAETIQPSHENGIRNPLHFIPEAQPKNRNDVGSLQAEESFANNPRFEELGQNTNAYSGSPVVNERGEVIQGNNRSAGLRKGYKRGNAKYKNDLTNNAEKFGFTKDQVESMNNPVLVREIAVSDAGAIELGNYDVKDLETGGKRRLDPVSITRRMPFELKGRIAEVLFKGDDTLNKSLRDNSKKILELLSPYLNQSQRNTLFKDGVLTESGAKDLEAVVQHFLFDGGDVALPDLFESLSHTQKEGLRKSLPSIFSTTSDKSITPQIQEAIIAINSFNESGINNFDNWLGQTDMFNEGKTPNDTFSPTAIAIAKILNTGSQKEIVAEFAKYADVVKDKPATMFEEAKKGVSKKEAIEQIFKTEYNETAEQKAIGTRGGKEVVGKPEAIEKTKPKSKPKPKPTESQAVKDYKEAVTKASKKAKENAKKEFVDRNFDLIIEKLKIQIKCPT